MLSNVPVTKQEKRTVEEHLNLVDYEFKGFMPTEEALRFVNFIKAVNGGAEENETPLVHLVMMGNVFNKDRRCAIMCHRGIGKRQPTYSKIKTPTGWTTMGEVQVGDKVINRYGKTTKVTYKTPEVTKPVYRITLSDGSSFDVDEDHNNIVWMYRKKSRERVLTTKELLTKPLFHTNPNRISPRDPKRQYTYGIPLVEPVEMAHRIQKIDPYVMGIMLADGHFRTGVLSCHIDDMIETARELSTRGCNVRGMSPTSENGGRIRLGTSMFKEYKACVFDKKYIPEEYMNGSIAQRLLLLQGLMDGDGSLTSNGGSKFFTSSKGLAEQVVELARSLGAISYIKAYDAHRKGEGKIDYVVIVNSRLNPFKLGRKADKWKPTKKACRAITKIELIGEHPGHCIAVESDDHSYVTDNYTVTHNTTVFAEYLILYVAAFGVFPGFGTVNLMLYVTDSIENGVKNLRRNVEYRYQESEFLRHIIPNQRITVGTDGEGHVGLDQYESQVSGGRKFTDIRLEFMNIKGHRLIVKGYGALTGVRGAKELGKRPNVAILDDLMSDEGARSDTIIETINNTIYKAVSKALHPTNQKMIFIGTPFNAKDPLYEAVESGAWTVSVFPVCERFPVSREEFKGSWEDRFTYDYVKAEYDEAMALNKPQNFYQELMLRIMSNEDRLVQDDDIVWYKRTGILSNKSAYNFYITTDFATSVKKGADFSVISVWAYNSNGDWLLVDGICKKQLMDENIKSLFRFVTMYRPLSVGIETTGQQGGFISWINQEMVNKNIFFNIASGKSNGNKPGIRPVADKLTRFNSILPMFKQKKIWLPEEMKESEYMNEMEEEIRNASRKGFKSKHDDVLDTVSMLSELDAYRPTEDAINEDPDVIEVAFWGSEMAFQDNSYKSGRSSVTF